MVKLGKLYFYVYKINFYYLLDSMVDVNICCKICGKFLVFK